MAHNFATNVRLDAESPVALALGAEHALICSRGCGALLVPGRSPVMADGTAAPRVCSSEPAVLADGHAPPLLSPDVLAALIQRARLPTRQELAQEDADPAIRFGDPLVHRGAQKERSSVTVRLEALSALYGQKAFVLLTAILHAIMETPEAALAAVHPVRLASLSDGSAGGPVHAPIPLRMAVAEALVALATSQGVSVWHAHAVVDAPRWKSSPAPAFRFDTAGVPHPIGWYWHTMGHPASIDVSTRAATGLWSVTSSAEEAMEAFRPQGKIVLHGASASVLDFAPVLGLLRGARWIAEAAAPTARMWGLRSAALLDAAASARKEFKGIQAGPVAVHPPRPGARADHWSSSAGPVPGNASGGRSSNGSGGRGRSGRHGRFGGGGARSSNTWRSDGGRGTSGGGGGPAAGSSSLSN